MKRLFLIVLLTFLIVSTVSATTEKVTLVNPLGPTVIPISALMAGKVKTPVPVEVKLWRNPDEALALLASKNVNFAVLPITSGSIFYTRGVNVSLLGVYEWKVFYLVASENATFTNWHDLVGKTVYTPNGRGQTVDVLMRFLMTKSGVNPDKDVRILYAPPQEIVSLFRAGKVSFAALPEPFVTMAILGKKGKIVFDFQKGWAKAVNTSPRIPIAGLFVKKSYMKSHPQLTLKVANAFSRSVKWMNENPASAVQISMKYLKMPAKILNESLKRTVFYYVPISKCEKEVKLFLQKMHELYPKGMPKLPNEGFYAK